MEIKLLFTFLHLAGVALGVGGATASDALFFRAMKDKKISEDEIALLATLSKLVWGGLFLFLFSGVSFLFLQYFDTGEIASLSSEPFLAKLTLFVILFLNAFAFHFKVFPLLRECTEEVRAKEIFLTHTFRLALVGSLSIVTWYFILILGVIRKVNPLSYVEILGLYILILGGAVLFARFLIKRQA